LKVFEDSFPQTLYGHFPIEFGKRLLWGRRDDLGFDPKVSWYPAFPVLGETDYPSAVRPLRRVLRYLRSWSWL